MSIKSTKMKTELRTKFPPLNDAWWKVITIEPSVALFQITTVMSNQLYVNLYLQRACRFNATREPDLRTKCDDEKGGQLFLTHVNSWRYTVSMTLMIIFTVFVSSWSDKAGRRRRPLILIPLIGLVLVTINGAVFSHFWTLPTRIIPWVEIFLHGITGGRLTVIFSSQLYICDITNEKNRTTRLGVIHGINIIAIPIGSGIVGFMMRYLGFTYSYLICTGLATIAVILAMLLMEDVSEPVENNMRFWDYLNPTRVVESFRIIFKRRAYSKRKIIILLLGIEALSLLPIIGESSVLYLYLRYRFQWNEKDYSLYSVYKMTLVFIGTMFCTSVLSKYYKIHDGVLGAFASVFNTIAAVFFIFACNTWQLYLAPVIDMFHGTGLTVVSAFVTKCLEKHETGHLMSVRCILQIVTPFCFPIYNYVYRNTIDFFPSAFFLINMFMTVPCILLFGLAYYLHSQTQIMEISPS
ncbi:lysosomal proton-coupled steroid conjugate and bile acid symporter SLC46A3-like [Planococcus citri]|uniref:lysosomal proton-coupled steroid conjugate and bile acid symporter SLC46A3-like n=1 Tax=Planococcus citri TaxID=170843 RepID=UPI0031F99EC6